MNYLIQKLFWEKRKEKKKEKYKTLSLHLRTAWVGGGFVPIHATRHRGQSPRRLVAGWFATKGHWLTDHWPASTHGRLSHDGLRHLHRPRHRLPGHLDRPPGLGYKGQFYLVHKYLHICQNLLISLMQVIVDRTQELKAENLGPTAKGYNKVRKAWIWQCWVLVEFGKQCFIRTNDFW